MQHCIFMDICLHCIYCPMKGLFPTKSICWVIFINKLKKCTLTHPNILYNISFFSSNMQNNTLFFFSFRDQICERGCCLMYNSLIFQIFKIRSVSWFYWKDLFISSVCINLKKKKKNGDKKWNVLIMKKYFKIIINKFSKYLEQKIKITK